MDTLRDIDLVRAVDTTNACSYRAAESGSDGLGTMEVAFSPFRTFYRISSVFEGDFMEQTVPGAFRKTISENIGNMRVQFDHGHDPSIGSKVLGGIVSLEETSRGPVGVVELDDTSYVRDLLPGLKRGRYGSSFRFRVMKDEWNDAPGRSEHNPDGVPERTIKEVRLMEFGPVTWPANPQATAGIRSATDDYYQHLRSRDPEGYDDLVTRATTVRTPAAQSTGAAEQEPNEPVRSHSGGYAARRRREVLFPFLNN